MEGGTRRLILVFNIQHYVRSFFIRRFFLSSILEVQKTVYHKSSNYWDREVLANSAGPDQTAPKEHSDQGLHCLPLKCIFQTHLLQCTPNCSNIWDNNGNYLMCPIF